MNTIIYGANHNNTLGLVRSLGEGGHNVFLLLRCKKVNYVDKSKYVKKTVYLYPDSDVIKVIKRVASSFAEKPVLFTTGDSEATLIDDHLEELSQYVITEGGLKNNEINKYRDKQVSNELARCIGFTLPKAWIVNSPNIKLDIKNYPVIVKANNSVFGGKSILKICQSNENLVAQLKNIPIEDYPVQVQEFIDKDFEIMLQGCSMEHGKKVVSRVANRKIRFYPNIYSAGSYSYSINIEEDEDLMTLCELTNQYLSEIHYSGLFSTEFLYSKGKYYFLEVNLRNDGTAYLSTACGCNLPDIYCRYLEGKDIGEITYRPNYYMNMVADFHHVKLHHISFFKWLCQFWNTHCFSHFNKRDVKPYFYYLCSCLIK